MICNALKNDFLISIPNPKSRNAEEGFLLVVTADPSIEYGALKVFYFTSERLHKIFFIYSIVRGLIQILADGGAIGVRPALASVRFQKDEIIRS